MRLDNWFTAIVTNLADPLNAGRVQIRCYEYHTTDEGDLPDVDLPWALPLTPITSASSGGTGISATGLLVGSWVFGFFRDADNQDPVIIGSIPGVQALNGQGIPDTAVSVSIGSSAAAQYVTSAPVGGEAQTGALGDVVPNTTTYTGSTSGGNITEDHAGKTRSQPLSAQLKAVISRALTGTGLNWYSTSGGQPPAPGGPRTGSTRHDNGRASDGDFKDTTGRTLNADNLADRARIANALSRLKAAGILGVGWDSAKTGKGHYMGSQRFHLDIARPGTWGYTHSSNSAAPWVLTALRTQAILSVDGDYDEEISPISDSTPSTDTANTPTSVKSSSSLANKFVSVAHGEIGKNNGTKYGASNGGFNRWDAEFVGWCLKEAGIPETELPSDASQTQGYINWVKGPGKKYFQLCGDDIFKPGDIVINTSSMAIISVGCINRQNGTHNFIQGDVSKPSGGRAPTNSVGSSLNNTDRGVYEYKTAGNNMSSWSTVLRWNEGT
jgi:hypothetical protein